MIKGKLFYSLGLLADILNVIFAFPVCACVSCMCACLWVDMCAGASVHKCMFGGQRVTSGAFLDFFPPSLGIGAESLVLTQNLTSLVSHLALQIPSPTS